MGTGTVLVVRAVVALFGLMPASSSIPPRLRDAQHLLGQRIMIGFPGPAAPASVLADIRAGHAGAVILFGANIAGPAQLRRLTTTLQGAARAGGQPPLLIATDQEGGEVKRLPDAPPDLTPPEMTAAGRPVVAEREGFATGRALKRVGINWDLAPVFDVPTSPSSFIWREGRAFSFRPTEVARFGTAFALGLQRAGVAAGGQDFPGVGAATVDNDRAFYAIRLGAAGAAATLAPYRQAVPAGLDTVMLANAAYPRWDATGAPAMLSRPILIGVLRRRLHFQGVTITDALRIPTGHDELTGGRLAARAGDDVLLYADGAPGVLGALIADLRSGRLRRVDALASVRRILAFKRAVAACPSSLCGG